MSSFKVPVTSKTKKALALSAILSRVVYESLPDWSKERIFTEPTPTWAWNDDPNVLTNGDLATRQGELYSEKERAGLKEEMMNIVKKLVFIEDIKSDTQCYVGVHNRVAYVVFRGSTTYKDWTKNIDWELRDFENSTTGAKIHDGFYSDFNVIRARIFAQLDPYVKDFDKILVTGHSLGGAMATVAAIIFHRVYTDKRVFMHSFAAPRVGNAEFCNEYNACGAEDVDTTYSLRANSWRVFIEYDMAPMVPKVNIIKVNSEFPFFSFPMLFYQHVEGNVLQLTDTDARNTYRVGGEKDNEKDGTVHAFWLAANAYSNHSYDLYVDRVLTLPTLG